MSSITRSVESRENQGKTVVMEQEHTSSGNLEAMEELEEEVVVIPDRNEYADADEIPPADEHFLLICNKIDSNMAPSFANDVWEQFYKVSQQVVLESSLAVSAVVFKKLLPIYRRLFRLVDDPNTLNSQHVFSIIWLLLLVLKKSLPSEDLMSSFHLLLCVVELVYKDLCFYDQEPHIESQCAEQMLDDTEGVRVLEWLCVNFEGVVLDAKHFRTHWFDKKRVTVLKMPESLNISVHYKAYLENLHSTYNYIMCKRGELDERMFIPEIISNVFNPAYDSSAVELLRRGADDSTFADAELLLRMSTQSYIISSDQLRPLTPLSSTLQNSSKLAFLIPTEWNLTGSDLERYCLEMRDNPLPTIALNADIMGEKFVERIAEERHARGADFDPNISNMADKHRDSIVSLFYILMEKIARAERDRLPNRDTDFANVFRKEEFLSSVFCCAIELVLFSYESERIFPWSIQLYDLSPVAFHKIIEVVIRAEPELSREMVKHLNKTVFYLQKEEQVLEELAWSHDSPVWAALNRRADCVPSCEAAWRSARSLANNYSPIKRRRLESDQREYRDEPSSATTLFFRKVYYVAYVRLTDLCDRIRIDDKGRKLIWTLLEHVLRTETSLLAGRHLDQNLLCIVYVIAKFMKLEVTFMDIMSHYRHQPQAKSHVYREVTVDASMFVFFFSFNVCSNNSDDGNSRDSCSGGSRLRSGSTFPTPEVASPAPELISSQHEKVDLIHYYNKVFLLRVEEFVKRMDGADTSVVLVPMPMPRFFGMSPVKRALAEGVRNFLLNKLTSCFISTIIFKVTVLPLSPGVAHCDRPYKYNINTSPRKDLRTINRVVNVGNSPFYSISAAVPDKAAAFGSLYRHEV
uniref:Retinoblastoma-associated protein n=1 Tax=Heterorhabditis bacteriophora TaxID=37862 RepID=A0A1I7XF17_HETBA